MNRSEFEHWMKEKMEQQPFFPSEDKWNKLQQELQQPRPRRQAFIFFPFVKIAAGIVVVAGLGSGIYFLNNTSETSDVPARTASLDATKPSANPEKPAAEYEPAAAQGTWAHSTEIAKAATGHQQTKPSWLPAETTVLQPSAPQDEGEVLPALQETHTKPAIIVTKNKLEEQVKQQADPKSPVYYALHEEENGRSTRGSGIGLGLAANIGKPSVGSIGYQVGLVGRKEINSHLYLEAAIAMASTTVSYSEQHTFPGLAAGFDQMENLTKSEPTTVNANYGRNVVSLGVNPSVGIRLSRNVSVSAGAAAFRNLNPTLQLTNEQQFDQAILNHNIVDADQNVTEWDLGITGNADFKLTENLSVNANYRQGLTNYLNINNAFRKNSGFNIGLKYIFAK